MMSELFAAAVWTMWAMRARFAARIAFSAQTFKLAPTMMKLRQASIPVTLFAAAFAPFAMAHAMPEALAARQGSAAQERAPQALVLQGISLDEAVSRAERQYRARVVRTEVQDEDGRKVYVLKLLSDNGRVFTVRIDAATGRMR